MTAIERHVCIPTNNVRVFFPYQPYGPQIEFVESVIQALSNKHNALLESPTGTGKTLSLLCSSLAWQQSGQPGTKTIIYYTSRTHMQLSQAAKEMKKSAYGKVPAVVMGSRAKMCLNQEVRQMGDNLINRACRNAKAKNACSYYANYEQKLEVLNHDAVHDIEDLLEWGKTSQCCPYYAAKKIAEVKASIVFMPYNYLLDTSIRRSLQLKLENSVIIFDEAHNIETSLKDAVSGFFSLTCLKNVQESCLKLPEKLHEALNKEKHGLTRSGYEPKDNRNEIVDEFAKKSSKSKQTKEPKVNPIEELSTKLTNDKLQQVNRCAEALKIQTKTLDYDKPASIERVIHVMKEAGIHYSTSDSIITTLDSMASFWSIAGVMNPTLVARYVESVTRLWHIISLIYPTNCLSVARQMKNEQMLKEHYTSYMKGIYNESIVLQKGSLKDWELHLWCLHPAIGLKQVIDSNCINGPRSLIITSGTLAPMYAIPEDLEISIPIQKELKHVISKEQMKIMYIEKSPPPTSQALISDYKNVTKQEYFIAIGKTLLPLIQVLPFGTLIFFTSYTNMDRAITIWKKWNIWRDMTNASSLFIENTKQDTFNNDVINFKKNIDGASVKRGKCVFFGVYRGKLSEGINFIGNQCRSVILTGLPFPSAIDPKIVSTRLYHENRRGAGRNWYSMQMSRALNQTIGRVIRSKEDFGMLFFCDQRFSKYRYTLSKWTVDFYPNEASTIDQVETEVKKFFEHHGVTISGSASENCGAFDIGFSATRLNSISPINHLATSSRGNGTHEVTNGSSDVNKVSDETPRDRLAEMIESYTVSRNEFKRVQENRRQAQSTEEGEGEPKPKRNRLASPTDIFYNLCPSETSNGSRVNMVVYEPQNQIEEGNSNGQDTQVVEKEPPSTKGPNNSTAVKRKQNPFAKSTSIHKPNPPKPKPPPPPPSERLNKCFFCKWPAEMPMRMNCDCPDMIGCFKCSKVMHKKKCINCLKVFNRKQYQQILFKSS